MNKQQIAHIEGRLRDVKRKKIDEYREFITEKEAVKLTVDEKITMLITLIGEKIEIKNHILRENWRQSDLVNYFDFLDEKEAVIDLDKVEDYTEILEKQINDIKDVIYLGSASEALSMIKKLEDS